jgi:hypothetical protein
MINLICMIACLQVVLFHGNHLIAKIIVQIILVTCWHGKAGLQNLRLIRLLSNPAPGIILFE